MEKNAELTVSEAVHKIQLALLDGIEDDNNLFAAGSLMSKSDYEDVVTERTIANLCGYPLCPNSLPSDRPKKGQYHISIKEHRVYDLNETYMYCCSSCLINSKAFAGSLNEERYSALNPAKLNEILRLFENVGLEDDVGEENGKKNPSKLVIVEKAVANGGEVSMEEWVGPSNAIEGYVPQRDRRRKGTEQGNANLHNHNDSARNGAEFEVSVMSTEGSNAKSYQFNNAEATDSLLGDIDFNSVIITNDEFTPPKKFKGSSKSEQSGSKKGSNAKRFASKGKDSFFDSVDFMSTILTQDEYSVSKLHSSQAIPDPNQIFQEFSEKLNLGKSVKQCKVSEICECPVENVPQKSLHSVGVGSENQADQNASLSQNYLHHDQNDATSSGKQVKDESHKEKAADSSQLKGKSSLKKASGVKKLVRSVTWADEKANGHAGGNLCEFSDFKHSKEEGPGTSRSKETVRNDDSQRFASAEACARALIEAAEAVSSGQCDANDAVYEAGITVLPPPKIADEGEQSVTNDALEDVASEKWPKKPGNINSEFFDNDNSWLDGVPEGFSLTLSPFALMWDALFSWLTSSSLAYIYGREESSREEYSFVNGREYPGRVVLADGRSPEIRQTLSGCLTRALPELIAELKLPTVVSQVEKKVAGLLETMSFMDPIPPFRMKQWKVIALLFIDALSVCRIPELTAHLTSRRILFAKVLNGAQINAEEYEIMKDLMIPLGRVPQFAMQSGG